MTETLCKYKIYALTPEDLSVPGKRLILEEDTEGCFVEAHEDYDVFETTDGRVLYVLSENYEAKDGDVAHLGYAMLEKGTKHALSLDNLRAGKMIEAEMTVQNCRWVESHDDHDVFELPGGTKVYTPYSDEEVAAEIEAEEAEYAKKSRPQ